MKRLLCVILIVVTLTGFSQHQGRTAASFNLEGTIAIKGHDPVAYFTQGKALQGKKELYLVHDGVLYYFYSDTNKNAFVKSPSSYEPQYGGWCAFAMGNSGDKVDVNPETFKIVDGKLYLFYNAYFNNTLKRWNRDQLNIKSAADSNWKKNKVVNHNHEITNF